MLTTFQEVDMSGLIKMRKEGRELGGGDILATWEPVLSGKPLGTRWEHNWGLVGDFQTWDKSRQVRRLSKKGLVSQFPDHTYSILAEILWTPWIVW